MPASLTPSSFVAAPGPILDVRSPGEYAQGHIPGAISFPLFSDEERAKVGICYKHQGRDAAVELGFDLAGPKFGDFVRQAQTLAPEKQVRLHCWRGGMRSGAVAWVLELAGFDVATLTGGYKGFRRWGRQQLSQPWRLQVLGGMTGTAKTQILHALAHLGEQVLDLEGLASHRGSSYGGLGLPPQPSTEHFENLIFTQLAQFDPTRLTWVEAESRRVGNCRIPDELFNQMDQAPTLAICRSLDERLDLLVDIYAQADPEELVVATERIRRRLGGQRTQEAVALIRQKDFRPAFALLLTYYDSAYQHDLNRRQNQIPQIEVTGLSAVAAARLLQAKCPGRLATVPA